MKKVTCLKGQERRLPDEEEPMNRNQWRNGLQNDGAKRKKKKPSWKLRDFWARYLLRGIGVQKNAESQG